MHLLKTLRDALRELSGRQPESAVVPNLAPPEVPLAETEIVPSSEQLIPVVPLYDLRALEEFFNENETLINRYMVKRLTTAIKRDDDVAVLFFIPMTGQTASIRREDYETTLNNIITHFIKVEEYERISKCKKLLAKHSVNEVIRSSQ